MPLKTVDIKDFWDELNNIFSTYNIQTVVLGLPLRTDGTDTEFCTTIRQLANEITSKFHIPVKLWDESFTTKDAEKILHSAGKQPSRNKNLIDKLSASIILEEYLSSL
jgi:putative Holliday junction resolvase